MGDLRLDPARHRCWRGETEIGLTSKEFSVLEYLMRRVGMVIPKFEILDEVWEYNFEGDPNIVELTSDASAARSMSHLAAATSKRCEVPAIGWPAMADSHAPTERRRRLGTFRSRLTLVASAVAALMLVASAVGLVVVQRALLTHGIDEALRQRADNIQVDVEGGTFGTNLPNEGDREDSFLQVLDEQGRVVAATANAATMPAVTAPLEQGSAQVIRTVPRIPLSSHEFRILARSVSGSETKTLVVGKNLDDVNESAGILTWLLAIAIPVVIALRAWLVWWLTGRVLRPVESIRTEVANIQGSNDLHRRVPVPSSYDEISQLARTMNEMLSRVEHVTNQQRQFVADASHELRGLLTRIRSDLEVSIAHPDTVDPDTMYRSLLTDATQLQQLIDNLLFLARSESSSISLPSTHVDYDDLVLEEARRLRDHGQVRVDASSVSAAQVLGDPNQLARAIRNLASNAERHAATTVRFELRECDGYGEVIVADDGPGIPAEHHARVSSGSRAWMTPVHGASAARVAALPSCMTSSSATGARSKSRRLAARGPGS